jgi:SAM-dependent methyltransferase
MTAPAELYPTLVFETLTAYRRTAALRAAIELDVFTPIAEGADTVGALAQRCRASERGVRILCDCLVVLGFLKKGADRYALTPESATFLDRRSPLYMGTLADFLNSPTISRGFDAVAAAVRKGGTVIDAAGTLDPEHPVWVEFARGMAPRAALTADLLADTLTLDADHPWRVLDIGASHGLFGIAIARRCPEAHIVAVDWHNVLQVADENARAAGVRDRVRLLPGSGFTVDFGDGYDLVLLMNFLHHFDARACGQLLRKIHAALRPDGRALALDFMPNEDRVSPPAAAFFSLAMLVTTPQGDAYTFGDYARMFQEAGFARSELQPLPPSPQRVVVSFK